MTKLSAFVQDEAGAVTVDWVVLTAAIVAMAMLIFPAISPGVSGLALAIGDNLEEAQSCMENYQSPTC